MLFCFTNDDIQELTWTELTQLNLQAFQTAGRLRDA
jgi:hypothetical protein